jgi:hypothetical protein
VSTPPREPTEAELQQMREAYEAELARITAADVIVQTAVTLINLAGRRLGLDPDGQAERDLAQVRDAIDAVRGLMPVLERVAPTDIGQLRAALSQLQMAYATEAGAAGADAAAAPPGPTPPGPATPGATPAGGPAAEPETQEPAPGPAQSSGRLWVPGS